MRFALPKTGQQLLLQLPAWQGMDRLDRSPHATPPARRMPRRRLPGAFSGLRFVPATTAGAAEPPRPRRPACPASADLGGRRAARPRSGYGPRRRHRPQRHRGGRSPWTPFPSVDRSPRRSASATVRHAAPVQSAPAPPRTIVLHIFAIHHLDQSVARVFPSNLELPPPDEKRPVRHAAFPVPECGRSSISSEQHHQPPDPHRLRENPKFCKAQLSGLWAPAAPARNISVHATGNAYLAGQQLAQRTVSCGSPSRSCRRRSASRFPG